MAASISFPTAFFSSDRAWAVSLPRRAVHLPGCLPPRRWLAAAASRVAAEAAPDASGKRRPRGITKSRPVSPELQAVVGEAEIPRTQALKKIWAYIKENNLQVSPFSFLYDFDRIEET
ncbi:SWIB [Musa troglodytarum]|uniref:SWIB n=1 Tax=Musa troglodytarum TaxID=320322 RepID=A0A9E7GH42_9LILI|nr:SWIB [Musa troglodytarum]